MVQKERDDKKDRQIILEKMELKNRRTDKEKLVRKSFSVVNAKWLFFFFLLFPFFYFNPSCLSTEQSIYHGSDCVR
jgi:hypothetical protein